MPDATAALFCRTALLPRGFAHDVRLTLAAGAIASVTPASQARAGDEIVAYALPGLTNLHSHAFQRALAGLAECRGPGDDDFWTWRQAMYRFLDRLGPDEVEAIAGLAYAEMLEAGFTRVVEFHYLHHDPAGVAYANLAEMAERIAVAAHATGIGLTLLPSFYAHGGFGAAPANPGQRRFLNSLDRFAALHAAAGAAIATLPGAVLGIAPHSLRAVSAVELAALVAAHPAGPIHIHAAEQTAEVAACRAATGRAPVAWLLAEHDVGARWCLIHATHMEPAEITGLARTGAVVGLCPLTEANLGDGIFAAAAFRSAGGRFGVGTDSNIQIDGLAELRQLEYSQRLRDRARTVLADANASCGAALYEAALAGGAQAAGAPGLGLARGAPADIVALDTGHSSLAGRDGAAVLDAAIFAAARPAIDRVWRAGVCVVRDGRHVATDAIRRRYAATLTRLLA